MKMVARKPQVGASARFIGVDAWQSLYSPLAGEYQFERGIDYDEHPQQ